MSSNSEQTDSEQTDSEQTDSGNAESDTRTSKVVSINGNEVNIIGIPEAQINDFVDVLENNPAILEGAQSIVAVTQEGTQTIQAVIVNYDTAETRLYIYSELKHQQ